jgi:hypothetical protein
MLPLSADDPIEVFTRFTRDWFRLLAHGLIAEAASRIDNPNSYGVCWNAEKIRDALLDYTCSESVLVSDPDLLAGDGRPNLVRLNDGVGFSFEQSVPVNGKWSDLTVQFEFMRLPTGYYVTLHDIHVL